MQSSKELARRDKKAFLSDQCKEIEENNLGGVGGEGGGRGDRDGEHM